jgi:hypothetical protein
VWPTVLSGEIDVRAARTYDVSVPPDVADVIRALESCVERRLDGIEMAVHKHPSREGLTITQIASTSRTAGFVLAPPAPEAHRSLHRHPSRISASSAALSASLWFRKQLVNPLRRVSRLLSLEPARNTTNVGVAFVFDADELWIFNRADALHVVDSATGRQPSALVRAE